MKTFIALLKREHWEHRGAFLKTPIITGIVFAVIVLLSYLTTESFDVAFGNGETLEFSIQSLPAVKGEDIASMLDILILGLAHLYHFILFMVIFFFLLGSLYDDRKDGSILFWKSLPISDSQTVFSKLATACLVGPLIFSIGFIISVLLILILLSFILLINGVNPFTILWGNLNVFTNLGAFLVGCLVQMIWALPLYAWLMFSSAFAKRRPFLLAFLGPLLLSLSIYFYNAIFHLKLFEGGLGKIIAYLFAKGAAPFSSGHKLEKIIFDGVEDNKAMDLIGSMLLGLRDEQVLYGLLFAVVAVGIAIYIRRYRNTV